MRGPIDVNVGQPERLFYEGATELAPPLRQDARTCTITPGGVLDAQELIAYAEVESAGELSLNAFRTPHGATRTSVSVSEPCR